MYADIPEEMRALVEPVLQAHGLELVDLELVRGRRPWQVRVTVDTPKGDGRVSVDRLASASRELGTQLDAADAIPVSYELEVSSPGLDRKLAREKDFQRARGEEVRIETRRPLEGRRRFRGRLVGFDDGIASVCVDGEDVRIPFSAVARASTVYHFSPADFARGAGR